ncbi:MAG: hypothetical protein SH850_28320 [Planctomycetaceae bacterium]|nr:hypothetical protein [Planctomycetaceae bacterium]
MSITLTARDQDFLECVTGRVRLLCSRQVAELWSDSPPGRTGERWVYRLWRAGLVERHQINAHPLLAVDRPLFAWKPGAADPDPADVSRASRDRWQLAAQPVEVYVATRLLANLFGSTARGLPKPEHRDHDLRLATVFVHYRQRHPRLARLWVGEHVLPKAGYQIKDPDAFLRDPHGRIRRVIESAGRYDARQVESFHDHCVEHDLPYELW